MAVYSKSRLFPNAGRTVIHTPSGRTYDITGPTVDIPFPDAEAVATDQATRLMVVGTSEDRPTGGPDRIGWPPPGMYDTTSASRSFWFRDRTRRAGWILRARQSDRGPTAEGETIRSILPAEPSVPDIPAGPRGLPKIF